MASDTFLSTDRRGFMGRLSALAAVLGLGGATGAVAATPAGLPPSAAPEFEAWLESITGKHRQVFDAATVNDGAPVRFATAWMNTMRDTYGLADADLGNVIVVRHSGVVLGLGDAVWAKYQIGERYQIIDPATSKPAVRNPWASAQADEAGAATFTGLLARGAKMAACGLALSGRATSTARALKLDVDQVKKEWTEGLLPGVVVAPSGVLAVHRAQQKGCTYCYGG